jgi:hypothetical protein
MKAKSLVYILISLAVLVSLHQYIFYGKWFELKDIHHETFMVALLFSAIILYFLKVRKKEIVAEF